MMAEDFKSKSYLIRLVIVSRLNIFLASGNFCDLLIPLKFANSLDPDQDQPNVGPDLDPNSLTLMVFLKENINFENSQGMDPTKQHALIYSACKQGISEFHCFDTPSKTATYFQ